MLSNIHQWSYISLFICNLYQIILLKISMQICKLCDDINANDICPSMLIEKCLLIMQKLVILMLIRQHKAYFLIQLNAESLYPCACWSLCLLCLLILMLIILMLILIESRSMLIVYWLGDRFLINAYLTENSIQNIDLPKGFLKILNLCIVKYTSMCLYILVYFNILLNNYVLKKGNQHTDIQIRQCYEC